MAVLENPVSKESIEILFADETVLRLVGQAPPDHVPPPVHLHRHQEERFEVVEGRVTFSVAGRDRILGAGESLTVAPGKPHTFRNSGEGTMRMITEFRPPLHMQDFFENFFGLATEGAWGTKRRPRFLQMALSCPWWDMYLAKPPVIVQRVLFALVGPLARVRGYRATYPRFEGTLSRPAQAVSRERDSALP